MSKDQGDGDEGTSGKTNSNGKGETEREVFYKNPNKFRTQIGFSATGE